MGPGAETLLRHGALQQALAIRAEVAKGTDLAGRHLGVAVDLLPAAGKAFQLNLARANHSLADFRRSLRNAGGAHFLVVHRRNINMNVDAVHERTGNL